MNFKRLDNFRLTDRNKAGGDAVFEVNGALFKADFIFYLQGYSCLSIRVGRHDKELKTQDLEDYITNNKSKLKSMIKPDIERLKKEREAKIRAKLQQ